MNLLLKVVGLIVVVLLSPVIWAILWLTYPILRNAALEVEPLKPQEQNVGTGHALIREVAAFIFLPAIAIAGLIMATVSDDDE